MKQDWGYKVFVILCLIGSIWIGLAPLILPTPAPVSTPLEQFSAERAMAHVRRLAQAPRVAGSTGMDQAAQYLVEGLSACKLTPQIRDAPSPKGLLHNVVARLPGSRPGSTLVMVSHVDSVSTGAGDNASGAAVLMEVACSLKAGKQLQNDIVLLFEDGEEDGYLGGYAFAQSDPAILTTRRVIGLDTAAWGQVVLLQTTPGNAIFINVYAATAPAPAAFGFFADADWNISHDSSEIQPFYERGIPGLELEDPTAFTGKHTASDGVEGVQPGSIQQMGGQALALARFLGDSDLARPPDADQSYFTLWGSGVVHYPANWNGILAILSAIGLAALAVKSARQKTGALRPLAFSTILFVLVLAGAGVIGLAGTALFARLFPNPNPSTGSYLVPESLPFFLAVIGIVVLAFSLIRRKIVETFGPAAMTLAGLVGWLLLSLVSLKLLPVGSYLFVVPLFTATGASLFAPKMKWVRIAPAVIAALLLAPNVALAFLGTGLETLALVTVLVTLTAELWAGAVAS